MTYKARSSDYEKASCFFSYKKDKSACHPGVITSSARPALVRAPGVSAVSSLRHSVLATARRRLPTLTPPSPSLSQSPHRPAPRWRGNRPIGPSRTQCLSHGDAKGGPVLTTAPRRPDAQGRAALQRLGPADCRPGESLPARLLSNPSSLAESAGALFSSAKTLRLRAVADTGLAHCQETSDEGDI